jgi:hypothetical protein
VTGESVSLKTKTNPRLMFPQLHSLREKTWTDMAVENLVLLLCIREIPRSNLDYY